MAPAPAETAANDPEAFTPIFNGKDLSGWHISKTNHHGTAPRWEVANGMIAVQVHRGNRWKEGGLHRFRVIAVKELP